MKRATLFLTACLLAVPAAAQGPITPRTRADSSQRPDARPARGESATGELNKTPPRIPVEEVISKFAAKEAEFREARNNYTYSQSILVQDFDPSGAAGGRYERRSDVIFSPDGRRYEKASYEPPSSLKMFNMSPEDMKDIENLQPFVLTTEDLPKYVLEYQGQQQVDEITAYVFSVRPRILEKGQRYFEGTIWVDETDLQIVKTYGKAVPDLRSKNGENLFPKFETIREQIDGKYWFPTYTKADDVLHFKAYDARIRMVVRYTNYKQFKSSSRIVSSTPIDEKQVTPPPQKPPR